jgi:aspartyl-tRNA(Asn)/glutamyl-tRNA(Gln) amidotransferase subunit A
MDALTRSWIEDAPAVELAEHALDAIARHNGAINAVLTPLPEMARADAEACDAARREGRRLGPMHGMPITLKDNIDIAGIRTTAASDFLADNVATEDAEIVNRLRRAGAVIVGKANLHEFACGATSQSQRFGPCFNPWNPAHVPGGSSGGSGAGVAAGMCVLSIGSDTGGSIRAPASFNGVAGLKPTNGAVPNRGTFPVSPPHDTPGPLARRVEDLAACHMAIAGFDPNDPTSEDRPIADAVSGLGGGIAGMTIGLPRAFFHDDLQPEVSANTEAAIAVLAKLGARVEEVELPEAAEAWRILSTVIVMTDAAALHRERMESESQRMGRDVFDRIAVGRDVSGMQYAEALRFREHWRQRVASIFRAGIDMLAMPTTPFTAPLADPTQDMGLTSNRINRNNFPWSLAGVPALSLPSGFDAGGLPTGLQLVGPRWHDARLLIAGKAFQDATDWHLGVPPLG